MDENFVVMNHHAEPVFRADTEEEIEDWLDEKFGRLPVGYEIEEVNDE